MITSILFRVRPNIFFARGGDTVLLEKYIEILQEDVAKIYLDTGDLIDVRDQSRIDLTGIQIVHLFNFALPDALSSDVKFFKSQGKKVVITALAENVEHFKANELKQSSLLIRGRSENYAIAPFDNRVAISSADMILATGERERQYLISLGTNPDRVKIVGVTSKFDQCPTTNPFDKYQLDRPYILCVARLEGRKNQLSLLHALKGVNLPLVLVGGNFCYQPEYAEAIRKVEREGRTIILSYLEPGELVSFYRNAAVHVLPSFCELPGLVSIEAYLSGTPIVVTDTGSTFDYLPSDAAKGIFICEPDNLSSIQNATLDGYYCGIYARDRVDADLQNELRIRLDSKELRRNLLSIYHEVLIEIVSPVPEIGISIPRSSLELGEEMMFSNLFLEAQKEFIKYLESNPTSVRALRGLASSLIAQGKAAEAKQFFEMAIDIDSRDAKSFSGIGMCAYLEGDLGGAYDQLVSALNIDPFHVMTLKTLLELSFKMNRYNHLIGFLEQYLEHHKNLDLQYCLAATLYKVGARSESIKLLNEIKREDLSERLLDSVNELLDLLTGALDISGVDKFLRENCDGPESEELVSLLNGFKKDQEELSRNIVAIVNENKTMGLASKIKIATLWGEVCTLNGNLEQAESIYNKVIDVSREKLGVLDARALNGLAVLCLTRSEIENAERFFDESIEIDETDVAFAGLGLCKELRGENHLSASYYSKALELNSQNRRALISLASLPNSNRRLTSYFKDYLEKNPLDMEMNTAYVKLLRNLGEEKEANRIDQCLRALL